MDSGIRPDKQLIRADKSYVKIRYTVRIPQGPILKGAGQPEVMDFVTGYMQVVPGLENRLIGHCAGEKLSFTIPPHEAFGDRREDLVIEQPKDEFHFPQGVTPYPGMEIPLVSSGDNAPDTVVITAVREQTILIDLNPPMAGVPLHYDLEILEARAARSEDVCSEWTPETSEQACCPSVQQIVLGADE